MRVFCQYPGYDCAVFELPHSRPRALSNVVTFRISIPKNTNIFPKNYLIAQTEVSYFDF